MLAVSDAYRRAPWAFGVYAADHDWWELHARGVPVGMRRWSQIPVRLPGASRLRSERTLAERSVVALAGDNLPGLGRTPGLIHYGLTSGYQAINLAWQLGARRVLLLGFDYQETGGKAHWFGNHPRPLRNDGARRYAEWLKKLPALAADAKEVGLEIVNCSRATAIDCFRRSTIQEELCHAPSC